MPSSRVKQGADPARLPGNPLMLSANSVHRALARESGAGSSPDSYLLMTPQGEPAVNCTPTGGAAKGGAKVAGSAAPRLQAALATGRGRNPLMITSAKIDLS